MNPLKTLQNILNPTSESDSVGEESANLSGFGADYDSMAQAFGKFTGSTIAGTMSMPRPWSLDYYALRERSWQAYTENELAAAFIDRLRHFVVNTGLKFQYEPSTLAIDTLKLGITDASIDWVEKDFNVYANSRIASLDGRKDLHGMADEAYLNMMVAGDLLVVLHIIRGELKIQHIDGRNLVDPMERSQLLKVAKRGGTIVNGVEYDKRGREVAFYVRQDKLFTAKATNTPSRGASRTERIPAYGKSGRLIAFRPSRDNQRIGSGRGKPLLTAVLQNLEVTRRYKLAELLAAEVNAMIVWAIEHDELSSGENPLQQLPSGGGRHTSGQAPELASSASSLSGDEIAGKMTQLTAGTTINLGRGQKLKATDTKRPNIDGADFLTSMNVDTAAATGIPYEIARMLFTSSYAASRAAMGMFALIVSFERKSLTDSYYAPIARERQRLRSLQGVIPAPKAYKQAIMNRDEFLLASVEKYRFIGVVMPDVDPLKEVKAAKARIDAKLSTHARETEALGTGDFETNAKSQKKERDILDSLGISDTLGSEDNNGDAKNALDKDKK